MKPERPAVDFASHRAWPKVPPNGLAEIILEAPRKVDDKLDVHAPSGSYGAYHDDRGHQRCHTATHDMPHAVRFYRVLGFEIVHGDNNAAFTRFPVGVRYPNLTTQPAERHLSWSDAAGMNQLPPQRLHGSEHGGIHEKTFDHYSAVLFSGHRFHRSSRRTAGWLYQRCDRWRYRWSFHGTRRNWGGRRVRLWHASA